MIVGFRCSCCVVHLNGRHKHPNQRLSRIFLSFWHCIIATSLLLIASTNANNENSYDVVEGVIGDLAKLRCKATKYLKNDSPILVLWYKEGARLPFFTLDLRSDGPKQFFDGKMKSRLNSDVTGEYLTLRSLVASDSAHYKCKVDYENSPTLEAKVRLIVYEPPNQILIEDESKRIYSGPIIGPLDQGTNLKLICKANGGNPVSKVSWWLGSELLTDQSLSLDNVLSPHEENTVQSRNQGIVHASGSLINDLSYGVNYERHILRSFSELNINTIERRHAGANITCRASNNNISMPLIKTLTLNVYLHPESVNIIMPKETLIEKLPARLKCETTGSYPAAKVSWEKMRNDKSQKLESKQSNVKDGKTISWLTLTPRAEDHGSVLSCRAKNPLLTGVGPHKSIVLEVLFAPRVHLQLGKSLVHRSIKEGEDVYFECEIFSNPRHSIITWHKDNQLVEQNLTSGILLSGENLVLQRITRTYAGNYTCTAENKLGKITSNVVQLPVMYLPVCSTDPVTIAVPEEKGVRLECKVRSRPSNDLKFIWLFNNTLDTVEVGSDRIKIKGPISYIDYTPLSSRDYGTLSCWATNTVGMQAEPCRFTVTEAGPPDRVKNCGLVNHTVSTLEVRCLPGSSGGSSQRFIAKVFDASSHTLINELRNKVPRFHVTKLTPGQDYLITVTAINDKGSSEPEEIDAVRLKVAEKRMGDVNNPPVSPLVGVFLGLVGGFILLLLVGLLLSRARSNRRSSCWCHNRELEPNAPKRYSDDLSDSSHIKPANQHRTQISSSSPIFRSTLHEDEEDSPDLVKSSNETSQLINSRKCPEMITRRHTYIPSPDRTPSPMKGSSCNGKGSLGSFLDPQSPIHLPNDESFV